jgi:hypothetical protein
MPTGALTSYIDAAQIVLYAFWIFFAGLGLTFLALYLLPGPGGTRMTWPLYPAAILLVFAALLFVGATALGRYLWPLALILIGLFLIYRALRPRRV